MPALHTFVPGDVVPEVVLPVTSAIAAIVGFFLMTGRPGMSFLVGIMKRQPVREDGKNKSE